jgi:hypothetical protein
MVAPVEGAHKIRWLILIYHVPRDPSRHRVAVWRKLKALGALYLQDGAAALPDDAVTREQLEWLQVRVREAGGEATLWEALPNTVAENMALVEEFCALREAAYRELIDSAGKLKRKVAIGAGGTVLLEELARIERDLRTERRRDYFRSPLRKVAEAAIREARRVVKEGVGQAVQEDAGYSPRRRPHGRQVRPPRVRRARRRDQGYAASAPRRRGPQPPHRRHLRRPVCLPAKRDALA